MRIGWLIGMAAATACSSSFPAPDNYGNNTGGPEDPPDVPVDLPPPDLGCAESPETMADCVERDRYVEDLKFIASVRTPGSEHWQEVQDLCFDRFTELGYDVELHMYGTGVNVIGTRLGTTEPDRNVVIAAHYDHIPNCSGADDNATGVAAVLEMARVLAEAELARTTIVACWDQEEIGLIGSRAWVLRAKEEDTDIVANFNFEMIGYRATDPDTQDVPAGFDLLFPDQIAWLEDRGFTGDFITVVTDNQAAEQADAILRHADRIGLPAISLPVPDDLKNSVLLADLRRSDHAPFWEFDQPAMMITDTSNFRYAAYHCGVGDDIVELLDTNFATQVVQATTGAAVEALGLLGKSPA